MSDVKNLTQRLDEQYEDGDDPELLFDIFLEWVLDLEIELYPAQEEAILEIFSDNHVILNTPTGSGKSLVALAMHFYSLATGRRSFYTSPIKALVSEKFFSLCDVFGAENVGMSTGDAAINQGAPIICCTAEILSALALSEGENAEVHHAAMDEFHYYGDRERGISWQIPLLLLPNTAFLLMSATLGDTSHIVSSLEKRTGRTTSLVKSTERPVPLTFQYNTKLLVHTVEELIGNGLSPVYVVNFSQREAAEFVQSLTSINVASKEEKEAIKQELRGTKFDTPYGKTVKKYLLHGIALHHGGLLPKYRLLVERLAQKGMLKVISGTDTLGVGINVPLRTVLFSKLCKYDGQKTRLLKVRDFKQIAGRAGRKGFDTAGLVLAQAPQHVIENMAAEAKADTPKKKKKLKPSKPPEKGYVHWDEETFIRLHSSEPEELKSRFTVNHAMLLNLLQRTDERCGYRALIDLIAMSHDTDAKKSKLRAKARMLFQSLRSANILEVVEKEVGRGQEVRLAEQLQQDFSVHHALSLFLVDVMERLNPDADDFHITALTFVESILENPNVVLFRQRDKARTVAMSEMKADGVEYDKRIEALQEIDWPQPDADLVFEAFNGFTDEHPWVAGFNPQPKSVARDMYERYSTFNEYVNIFGLERSEGVLLRHLSQTYKTLKQNIPDQFKTDLIHDLIAYLREIIARADSSLVQEWERMVYGEPTEELGEQEPEALDYDMKAFNARVRAELRAVVGAMAIDDLEEACGLLRQIDPPWGPMRMEEALTPFLEEHGELVFDHEARFAQNTIITREGPGYYRVVQILHDPQRFNEWYLEGNVNLAKVTDPESRLFALEKISNV